MSIKNFKIKGLGLLEDIDSVQVDDFEKFNILFGFNGSGKTTLSNLYNLFSTNSICPVEEKKSLFNAYKKDENSFAQIQWNSREKLKFSATSLATSLKKIFVFNQNFVSDHIFDGKSGNVQKFNISSTTLENPEIKALTYEIENKEEDLKKNQSLIQSFKIKYNSFKKIYGEQYRENYPGRKFTVSADIPHYEKVSIKPIEGLKKDLKEKLSLKNSSEDSEYAKYNLQRLRKINFQSLDLNIPIIKDLLKQKISSIAKEAFKKNIEDTEKYLKEYDLEKSSEISVSKWFAKGHVILQALSSFEDVNTKICPLCKSDITGSISELLVEFEDYFDKAYDEFKEKIDRAIESVKKAEASIHQNKEMEIHLPISGSNIIEIFNKLLNPTKTIQKLQRQLERKSDKPNLSEDIISELSQEVTNYNSEITKLKSSLEELILKLEESIDDPDIIRKDVFKIYQDLLFNALNNDDSGNNIKKNSEAIHLVEVLEDDLKNLKEKLSQEIRKLKIEAAKIGEYLEKLGITHFTIDLDLDKTEDNIHINYKSSNAIKKQLRNSLSEGEKTALAFAYFLSKINTEVSHDKKGEVVIILDDPISSLDDNRIYDTAFLIQKEFFDFRQLFILSHNLLFLKYINIFFKKEKKNYLMNQGKISNLPEALANFQSPYFYMIQSIQGFLDKKVSYDEARKYIPNYIRRVLETFLSFKYALLAKGNKTPGLVDFLSQDEIIDIETLPEQKSERVWKDNFFDKLSNLNRVCDAFSHGNIQNLTTTNYISDQSLQNVCLDALDIIRYLDGQHSLSHLQLDQQVGE
ncbi:MAG: AAA family ATPase [Flammeovirgaceae bacterium]|nr:AAA family ATPase [Flammeovirgaceae bacterium]